MPKLERWIIATRMVPAVDKETMKKILDQGGVVGGGWSQVHQHILVNEQNKEAIEEMLKEQGLTILPSTDRSFRHPDAHGPCTRDE